MDEKTVNIKDVDSTNDFDHNEVFFFLSRFNIIHCYFFLSCFEQRYISRCKSCTPPVE